MRKFSTRDTTNCSYKLYRITEIITDTNPNYRIEKLPERSNESLQKKTNLTMKENQDVIKKINSN